MRHNLLLLGRYEEYENLLWVTLAHQIVPLSLPYHQCTPLGKSLLKKPLGSSTSDPAGGIKRLNHNRHFTKTSLQPCGE